MTPLRCIIIEDEKPAQEVLKSYLAKVESVTLLSAFGDAMSAMDFLKRNEVDLILLDIQIPSVSGIEFLRILKNTPQVIITTAYSEFAVEAFDLDVRDYLKKPFSFERFLKALQRVSVAPDPRQLHQFQTKTNEQSFAFFNVNKTMVRVLFDDIQYIESMREYIYLHTVNGKVVTKMGTHEIEKSLDENFLRIHRSFIVNLKRVTAFTAKDVFISDTPVPIGASYKKTVEATFRKHLLTGP